ncbi:MAG: Fis family transcriptional regulator [Gammaproteobacteria bacterium]|nr:Fis family transcriptional regulator [Gammaproteobacteria bacterium]
MTAPSDWRSAFPLRSAEDAVDALLDAWNRLVAKPPPGISARTHEPKLTKHLKVSLENVVSREHGLLGNWTAEDVIGQLDPNTGELAETRRTDIAYCWNNETQSLKLVFEFKRLGKQKRHRDEYLGARGLARYVTGIYASEQPVGAMVGILLAPTADIVPQLQAVLADNDFATALRLRNNDADSPYTQPSTLFAQALFDTEHDRDPPHAPPHGYIRVAHFFVSFKE